MSDQRWQAQRQPPQPEQPPTWQPPYQGSPYSGPAYTPIPSSGQPPQWSSQTEQMSLCRRCGKKLSLLDVLGLDKKTHRCRSCNNLVHQSLHRFRTKFLEVTQYGALNTAELSALQHLAAQEHLDMFEALAFIGKDAVVLIARVVAQAEVNGSITEEVERYVSYLLRTLLVPNEIGQQIFQRVAYSKQRLNLLLLERTVAQAEAKGELTDEIERHIYHLQATLAIPNEVAQPMLRRVAYLKHLTNIRKGILPTIRTSVQLESDEFCHMEIPATYHKVNTKSTTIVSGRLIATSKKLHFLSTTRGTTINWSNIMRVDIRSHSSPSGGVSLELSKGAGNGFYAVADPILVGAVLDALVKISKRQLVVSNSDTSRHIPQDVKNAVWQRDGGKCVQCGATSYLEFDHIIPYTKGGASTYNNVQLLCRRCNQMKGAHI